MNMTTKLSHHPDNAAKLGAWLTALGSTRADAAADIVDVIHAARQCEQAVAELLALDPTDPAANAGAISSCLGRIQAWMLGEIQVHANQLAEAWPDIDAALEARLPADEE
jgi:hypothetical protein